MTQSPTWRRRKIVMKSWRSDCCSKLQIVGRSGRELFKARRDGSYRVINIIRITAETSNSAAKTSSSIGQNSKRKQPHQGDQRAEQRQSPSNWPLMLSILVEFPRA